MFHQPFISTMKASKTAKTKMVQPDKWQVHPSKY